MNQNLPASEKNKNWKAVVSLIIGFISIIPLIHLLSSGGIRPFIIVPPFEFLLGILSIPGIVLGTTGLKSKKKKIAISGIIISIISFLSYLFLFYVLWGIGISEGW